MTLFDPGLGCDSAVFGSNLSVLLSSDPDPARATAAEEVVWH